MAGPPRRGSGATGKNAIRDITLGEQVLERRARGMSFRAIAAELNVNLRMAHETAKAAIAALPRDNAEEWRASETARLEYLREQVQDVINRQHYVTHLGRLTDIEDDGPLLEAVKTDLTIHARLVELHGARVPVSSEVAGSIRVELVGVDMEALR